ncbi:MAG: Nudix family hydrolase [Chromatiales bacterium]|nr:Nudix family hydrolase [Chromatiales bacterium]
MPSIAPEGYAAPDLRDHLHVVVAVIENLNGKILIALRHGGLHQGGLWEFPGGKVEKGEDVFRALQRELHEELGINVDAARPLIRIPHSYPDRSVLLDVWWITAFSGEPHGAEGQRVEWIEKSDLGRYPFPAANGPIITAVKLPVTYLITPEPGTNFLPQLEFALQSGITLLQLRAPNLEHKRYLKLAREVVSLAHRYDARVLLNGDIELLELCNADGIHLNSRRLMATKKRGIEAEKLLAASCHNQEELRHAELIGIDFAVLSPVKETASHPEAKPLEWERFRAMSDQCAVPLYALGGMEKDDLNEAWENGAQGIAAIRALWM